jgi:hypothetical protein
MSSDLQPAQGLINSQNWYRLFPYSLFHSDTLVLPFPEYIPCIFSVDLRVRYPNYIVLSLLNVVLSWLVSGGHHESRMLFTVLLDNLDTQVLYILLISII